MTLNGEATSTIAPSTAILGVPISLVNLSTATSLLTERALAGAGGYVCVRDVHGIMVAQSDPHFLELHRAAIMVTPDGMPLVHVARHRGYDQVGRTCGPDLVDALCSSGIEHGLRHYFYGGHPGVAAELAVTLAKRHPGLIVSGTCSPPFGAVHEATDDVLTADMRRAAPHVIWVGLGSPKQEYWMRDHAARLPHSVLIGVGAAFDFYTGRIRRAPLWMQRASLEWLFRLVAEPRRLWRRYLIMGPSFLWQLAKGGTVALSKPDLRPESRI